MEKRTLFTCGTQWLIPSEQVSAMLHAQLANQSTGFGSTCPPHGASYIIIQLNARYSVKNARIIKIQNSVLFPGCEEPSSSCCSRQVKYK